MRARRYQNVNNGRAANVDEITGLLIAVLFAGQHTSSITTTWTGYHMIADQDRCVGQCGRLSDSHRCARCGKLRAEEPCLCDKAAAPCPLPSPPRAK